MNVLDFIRVAMVMAMMSRPPQGSSLGGGIAQKYQQELKPSGSLVGTVGKIPMINPGDAEHTNDIQENSHCYGWPTPPHKENGKNGKRQYGEWDWPNPLVLIGMILLYVSLAIGIEPGNYATE
jgi:hypothetical protein